MTSVTTVVNLTRHTLQVISGGQVMARWEPSGQEARRAEVLRDQGEMTVGGASVPRVRIDYASDLEGLPEPVPGTAYVVSRVVAEQIRRADIYFPWGEIRDDNGRIVGCRALGQFTQNSQEGKGDA